MLILTRFSIQKENLLKMKSVKDISLGEFLDSIIHNEDLKLVLLGNLGYFHDDPYSISLTLLFCCTGKLF